MSLELIHIVLLITVVVLLVMFHVISFRANRERAAAAVAIAMAQHKADRAVRDAQLAAAGLIQEGGTLAVTMDLVADLLGPCEYDTRGVCTVHLVDSNGVCCVEHLRQCKERWETNFRERVTSEVQGGRVRDEGNTGDDIVD